MTFPKACRSFPGSHLAFKCLAEAGAAVFHCAHGDKQGLDEGRDYPSVTQTEMPNPVLFPYSDDHLTLTFPLQASSQVLGRAAFSQVLPLVCVCVCWGGDGKWGVSTHLLSHPSPR